METFEYLDPQGRSPFGAWFDRLEADVASHVDARLRRLRLGSIGDWKAVGGGVCELRIHHGKGWRVYFARDGEALIVLLGGAGKRQKHSQQADIETAKARWQDYRARKKG